MTDALIATATEGGYLAFGLCKVTATPGNWDATISGAVCSGDPTNGPMYKQGIEISSNKIVPATGTGYKSNSCQTNFNFVPPDSAIGDRSRDVSFVCPPTGCQYYQDNSCPVGHPCKPASGAKVFTEVDFDPPDAALHFTRFYNSNGSYRPQNSTVVSPGLLGDFWRTNYDRTLFPISGSMYVSVAARRPDGTVKYFNSAGVEVGHFNGRAADILAPISGGGWTPHPRGR